MAIKTISLELDAYEKLKRMKRGRESFSSVVRRAQFPPEESTGAAILESLRSTYSKNAGIPKSALEYLENARAETAENPRISPSKWETE